MVRLATAIVAVSLWAFGLVLSPGLAIAGDIVGEEVNYKQAGVEFTGFLAHDAGATDRRPGVLVVHEWWGHNQYVRDRALMLAELGYTALAVDMYGDGKLAEHPEDAQKFMMEVLENMDTARARFEAARGVLETHPSTAPGEIAAIGYCFGGAIVLHMARTGMDLAAVASFHGNLGTRSPAQPGEVKAKILVLHGAEDEFVPTAQVTAFKQEMSAAGADVNFIAYPGAQHAFTNPEATQKGETFGLPLAYNKAADQASWLALEQFLRDVFSE